MNDVLILIGVAIASYLIGSIPTGFLVVRLLTGTDVTKLGSGRTSSTNAMRAGGVKAGILTALGDYVKGVLALLLARFMTDASPNADMVAGIMVVVGHIFSVFLKFSGGVGTAPNIGACTVMYPAAALWTIPLVPLGVFVIGYGSVASLLVAIAIPVTMLIRVQQGLAPWQHAAYAVVTALLVIWTLRPNIKRLMNGTERKASRALRK